MEGPLNWILAFAICLMAAMAESVLSGKNPRRDLDALKQPRWSLPFAAWMMIGVFYYAAMFNALRTLIASDLSLVSVRSALALALVILSTNAGSNWLLFRKRDYRAYHLIVYAYAAAVLALIALLARIDEIAALAVVVYAAYLPYAVLWTRALWRLNASTSS